MESSYYLKSTYEINALGGELKRSCSNENTSEVSVNSSGSFRSTSSIRNRETPVSRLRYFCIMNLPFAKTLTSDLIGESDNIINSWENLKYLAENKGEQTKMIRSKSNTMVDALKRKSLSLDLK